MSDQPPSTGNGEQKANQGQLALANFEILKQLAQTNLGKVKLAKEKTTGKICVLKYSSMLAMQRASNREDPIKEVKMLRYLMETPQNLLNGKDPRQYIVQLWGDFLHVAPDGHQFHFIVMEYVGGGEFFAYINNYLEAGQRITEELAQYFFFQLLLGTYYLHSKHIAHLDLKMENILLTKNMELKLCDFGMARVLQPLTPQEQAEQKTNRKYALSHGQVGTVPYMSPEVFANEPFDAQSSDVYSLGVILFILVCGVPPYATPATSDLRFREIINGGLKQLVQSWGIQISDNVADLLQAILAPQDRRLNLTQILQHKWFADAKKKKKEQEAKSQSSTMDTTE